MDERAVGNFRGSVFGGFNRADVVEYIRKMSAELSECRKERDKLREDCDNMSDRVSEAEDTAESLRAENAELTERAGSLEAAEKRAEELQSELDAVRESAKAYEDTKQRLAELEVAAVRRAAEIEKSALATAEDTLDKTDALVGTINSSYNDVKNDIEDIIAHLRGELSVIGNSLEKLTSVLDSSSSELAAFRDEAFAARDSVLLPKSE